MRIRAGICLVAVGIAGLASPAAAQGRKGAIELGLDAAFVVQIPQDLGPISFDNITALQWPLQFIRAGYYITDRAEVEVRTSVDAVSFGDIDPATFTIDIAYGYNFGAPGRTRYFVGAGGGIDYFSADAHPFGAGDTVGSAVRYGFGVGAGAKVPLQPQLAVRLEGNWSYDLEQEDEFLPAQHNVVARVGLSYFTK